MEPLPLSIAMIVRNEAHCLPQCLAALPLGRAELVVVDTGSEDETVAIARAAGARIEQYAMEDDFAAARNAALQQCRQPWVLMVDADEELGPGSEAVLRRWTQTRLYDGFYLARDNVTAAGQFLFRDRVLRLFRRHPDIYFTGCVHESVEPQILRRNGQLGTLEIVLKHTTARRNREKSDYYLRLLARAIAAEPDNLNLLDHQGCEYFRRGEYERSLRAFKEICDRGVKYPSAYANAGMLLAEFLQRPQEAVAYLRESVRQDSGDHVSRETLRMLSEEVPV